jgi:hypothetical protein
MGITKLSLDRLQPYLKPNSNILIIGCQNLYNEDNYGEIAANYFKQLGHTVTDIDIYECNGCQIADLRDAWKDNPVFDLMLQHGTIEHIDGGLHQPLKNLHESCKIGGIMIHENPKTGNWPGHGQHYFTKDFWVDLADECIYEVFEVTEEPAMGNITDGWNISCVLRKSADSIWIDEKEFDKVYKHHVKTI